MEQSEQQSSLDAILESNTRMVAAITAAMEKTISDMGKQMQTHVTELTEAVRASSTPNNLDSNSQKCTSSRSDNSVNGDPGLQDDISLGDQEEDRTLYDEPEAAEFLLQKPDNTSKDDLENIYEKFQEGQ